MDTPLGSVLYITLGCAKNEVDTDRMRSLLAAAGYEEAFDPQDADIAIVNTCSFLASATSESIETTLELANEVQDGVRSCPIVMCGCVPSRYGDDLPDELPEVAAFVKADEEDGIVAVIDGVLGVEREIAAYIPQVKRTVEGAVAYVKISDGCNRFCIADSQIVECATFALTVMGGGSQLPLQREHGGASLRLWWLACIQACRDWARPGLAQGACWQQKAIAHTFVVEDAKLDIAGQRQMLQAVVADDDVHLRILFA